MTGAAGAHSIPEGAVIAFDLKKCPEGWDDYRAAYGRFIRGIDKGQAKIDPDGVRHLSSIQEDQFAAHDNAHPKDVYDAGGSDFASWVAHARCFGYGHANPPRTDESGGTETMKRIVFPAIIAVLLAACSPPDVRPDNVALLFCEKM